MTWVVLAAVLALAFANGANDSFKGVATIWGSGSASYRRALAWAIVTTLAGSLAALILAASLIETFSGKGLVPDEAVDREFLSASALGAALTVLLATRLGLPVSTTHALTGALVGAGFAAVGSAVNVGTLGRSFALSLGASPVLAIFLTAALYLGAGRARAALGLGRATCICVGREWFPIALDASGGAIAGRRLAVDVGTVASCRERHTGAVLGLSVQRALDLAHFLSAGTVSFARGLNDAPKLVALLLAAEGAGGRAGVSVIALVMAAGGLLAARRVARTMSHRITALAPGQGLVVNLAATALVVGATRYGLPVSTTHVVNGGLFAIGALTGSGRWRIVGSVLAAWGTTLPLGAGLGASAYLALRALG